MAREWQLDQDGSPAAVLTMTACCLSAGVAAALIIALGLSAIVLLLSPNASNTENNVHRTDARPSIDAGLHANHW